VASADVRTAVVIIPADTLTSTKVAAQFTGIGSALQ
jgi:Flp pilus assembly pilin Flp